GLHTGLSGGWMLANWMVFILTESDHPKYNVEDWVGGHAELLSRLTGQPIRAGDFNDNRLSSVLTRLSKPERWERLEAAVWRNSVSVYEILKPGVGELYSAHGDSTTVSGYHQVHEHGVMQRGHSKDHGPDLAQLKLMTVAVRPYGQLIATRVASGETADDGLDLPLIALTRQMLGRIGVLYVGDSKMAALATRAQIAQQGDYYLTVAPLKGETAKSLPAWIEAGLSGGQAMTKLSKENGEQIGSGDEFTRQRTAQIPIGAAASLESFSFTERVQVIQSEDLRAAQSKSLRDRLRRAQAQIKALTPEPRQGRRQYGEEENFKAALSAVIEKHKVAGLLDVNWEVEEHKQVKLIGRGRAGADRPKPEVVTRRCQVKSLTPNRKAIAAAGRRLGWRLQLSNAPTEVSLQTWVRHYRANWRGERHDNRLKSEPIGIDPIYVRNDDQITGLTNLLTMAVRVESLIEAQVARGLQSEGKEIKGLYPGLPNKGTDHPTAVAMLKAIDRKEITLMRAELNGQTSVQLSPLPEWLPDVLRFLHLSPTLYADLQKNSAFDISIFGK
ncbi:MAG: IS1634 family transposase, partial [Blastocatellia bacterium]